MNIVIVEDELRTARLLAGILNELQPEVNILAILTSVQESIEFFTGNPSADLVFMDIQLSDGHSFDIFEEIDIAHPIIFCTAYNNYMTEAFKVNSIDYILKPFNQESIAKALEKFQKLKTHFSSAKTEVAAETSNTRLIMGHKKSLLVFDNNRYRLLPFEQIAYFFIVGGLPAIKTMDDKTIFIEHSLSAVKDTVPGELFYKINRQYIIQRASIEEVIPSYLRNLEVILKVPVNARLLVNKNKKSDFLQWLGQNPA